MEAKNQESMRRNGSVNFSQAINSTRREYVFVPVNFHVKLAIFAAMLSLGVYGLIANSLILHFKQTRRQVNPRAFSRSLIKYFIRSLCLSDILCSLISLPLFSTEMFVSFVTKDWICKLTRSCITFFPVVTVLNLLVIGVERYLAIFHPFFAPSQKNAKRMVVGAWILGVLITLISVRFVRVVQYDIGEDSYTLVCKYDDSEPLNRGLFTGFIAIIYVIPTAILTFISFRILRRKRKSRTADASENTERAISRLRVTRMFVFLIFALILPHMAYLVYSGIRAATKSHVSFTEDYIIRCVSASLIFANGSVSATILIYYEKLYLDFLACFRSRSTRNDVNGNAQKPAAPDPNKNNKVKTTPV